MEDFFLIQLLNLTRSHLEKKKENKLLQVTTKNTKGT